MCIRDRLENFAANAEPRLVPTARSNARDGVSLGGSLHWSEAGMAAAPVVRGCSGVILAVRNWAEVATPPNDTGSTEEKLAEKPLVNGSYSQRLKTSGHRLLRPKEEKRRQLLLVDALENKSTGPVVGSSITNINRFSCAAAVAK